MNADGNLADALFVAIHQKIALIRVCGRGSFQTGASLKQFGMSVLNEGCDLVIFDMADCTTMDSTFMGVIAGMALRLKRQSGGTIVAMNLNPKTLSLLTTLGLSRMIETYEAGSTPDSLVAHLSKITDLGPLGNANGDNELNLETRLSAHEDLVEASPENLPKFQDVIEFLNRDLEKVRASAGDSLP